MFSIIIKNSKEIINVSNFSKSEILTNYNTKSNITVIENAWQHYDKVVYDDSIMSKLNLKNNCYFFAMGSLDPTKKF